MEIVLLIVLGLSLLANVLLVIANRKKSLKAAFYIYWGRKAAADSLDHLESSLNYLKMYNRAIQRSKSASKQ